MVSGRCLRHAEQSAFYDSFDQLLWPCTVYIMPQSLPGTAACVACGRGGTERVRAVVPRRHLQYRPHSRGLLVVPHCILVLCNCQSKLYHAIGRALRETGQAMDRAGLYILNKPLYKEPCAFPGQLVVFVAVPLCAIRVSW